MVCIYWEGTTIHIDGNYEGGWKELYQRSYSDWSEKSRSYLYT
jgi:hypothetical protein